MAVTEFCFLASYLVAFGVEWFRLVRGGKTVSRIAALVAGSAGLVAHTVYLWNRSNASELPPLLSSSHDWYLVLAWMAVLFYLVLIAMDGDLAVGLFIVPLVLILVAAAHFISDEPNAALKEDLLARRGWAMLHATLLVFGIAGVLVGFVLSLMYLVQHNRMKHKQKVNTGLGLPSLERLSRMNWWAVVLSAPLLTLGMLTGILLGFQASGGGAFSFTDPVVIGSTTAWGVMIVFLVWRLRSNRAAGKSVAWRTIWAFGFLLVTLVGLQVLTGGGMRSFH